MGLTPEEIEKLMAEKRDNRAKIVKDQYNEIFYGMEITIGSEALMIGEKVYLRKAHYKGIIIEIAKVYDDKKVKFWMDTKPYIIDIDDPDLILKKP